MASSVKHIHLRDTLSNRPAAGQENEGYLFTATDVNGGTTYRSDGSTWHQIAAGVSSSGGSGGGGGTGNPAGTFPESGGGVLWEGNLDFRVAAGTGYIVGTFVEWIEQTITLDAADATHPRLDVIGVDDTGTVFKETGVPAANPSEPSIDPTSQLKLSLVLVPAMATEPDVVTEDVYLENTEWTSSTSGSGFNANSTNSPRTGAKCIEGTTVANNAYVQLQRGTNINLADYSTFNLFIKSKSAWNSGRVLLLAFYLNGVRQGNQLTLATGYWGFNSSNTTDYQLVSIPLAQFAIPAAQEVNQLRIQDSGGSIGFFIDDITLQSGTGSIIIIGAGVTLEQADARYLKQSSNLSDLGSASAARTNLGLGTAAVEDASAFDAAGEAAAAYAAAAADLGAHAGNTSNPHSVTKSQVGLGNVTNDAQLKAADLDVDGTLAANSDAKIPSQKAVKTYVDASVAGAGGGDMLKAVYDADDDGIIDSMADTQVTFGFDGQGEVLQVGKQAAVRVPFACTILSATLAADQSGDLVIDVWKDTHANYPPTDADSITASAPPELSGAIASEDTSLAGWSTAIAAGDWLVANIDSAATLTRATLCLKVRRT